jgi:hypothetical protein
MLHSASNTGQWTKSRNSTQVYYTIQNPSENSCCFLSESFGTIILFFAASWIFGWWKKQSLCQGETKNQKTHCRCPQSHQFRKTHLCHSLLWASLLFYHLILAAETSEGSTVSWLAPDCLAAVTSDQLSQTSLHSAASKMIRWVCKLICMSVYFLPAVHAISMQENFNMPCICL